MYLFPYKVHRITYLSQSIKKISLERQIGCDPDIIFGSVRNNRMLFFIGPEHTEIYIKKMVLTAG